MVPMFSSRRVGFTSVSSDFFFISNSCVAVTAGFQLKSQSAVAIMADLERKVLKPQHEASSTFMVFNLLNIINNSAGRTWKNPKKLIKK